MTATKYAGRSAENPSKNFKLIRCSILSESSKIYLIKSKSENRRLNRKINPSFFGRLVGTTMKFFMLYHQIASSDRFKSADTVFSVVTMLYYPVHGKFRQICRIISQCLVCSDYSRSRLIQFPQILANCELLPVSMSNNTTWRM
jgi:hypothetical protein